MSRSGAWRPRGNRMWRLPKITPNEENRLITHDIAKDWEIKSLHPANVPRGKYFSTFYEAHSDENEDKDDTGDINSDNNNNSHNNKKWGKHNIFETAPKRTIPAYNLFWSYDRVYRPDVPFNPKKVSLPRNDFDLRPDLAIAQEEGLRVVPLRSSSVYGHRAYNQNLPLESVSEAEKTHFRRSIVNQTFFRTNNFELVQKPRPVTCADEGTL